MTTCPGRASEHGPGIGEGAGQRALASARERLKAPLESGTN